MAFLKGLLDSTLQVGPDPRREALYFKSLIEVAKLEISPENSWGDVFSRQVVSILEDSTQLIRLFAVPCCRTWNLLHRSTGSRRTVTPHIEEILHPLRAAPLEGTEQERANDVINMLP